MKIAIAGLGRMGSQIARKLAEGGHDVVAQNRSREPIDAAVKFGAKQAYEKTDVVKAFISEKLILWLMVPAEIVDTQLNEWLGLIPKGSIIIDGGNSDFRLTKIRADNVRFSGDELIDVGTSGGVWGYKNGFCMMAGGDKTAFKAVEPILKTLSTPHGGYQYFGESGSGHFVKMVHNAIEYGMMESLAEGYRLLKEGPYRGLDLVGAGEVWQKRSVIASWVNELTLNALKENKELKDIDGIVVESGETRFALEVARDLDIEMPSIQSAFDVRIASQEGKVNFATKLLALMRNAFGGHKINQDKV